MAIGSRDFDQNGDPIKNVPPATFPGSDQILIGCSAKGGNGRFDLVIVHQPTIIDATVPVAVDLPNVGGADEVWFDGLAAQHYASASSSNPIGNLMPIIDANVGDGAIDTIITVGFSSNSGRKAHSVAGWSGNAPVAGNLTAFFVPIPAAGGGTAPFSSAACTTAAALGCIAYYTTSPIPTGTDSP